MNTLEFEIIISTSKENLWSAWTSSQNIVQWFAPNANIEPKTGGAFELFFDPSNHDHMTTKGCKFLEFRPYKSLSFNWKAPNDFADIMNNEDSLTVVKINFMEDGDNTKIMVIHSGWRNGEKWDKARQWHEFAWKQVLNNLKEFLEHNQGTSCCQ